MHTNTTRGRILFSHQSTDKTDTVRRQKPTETPQWHVATHAAPRQVRG